MLQIGKVSRMPFPPGLFMSRRLRYLLLMCSTWFELAQRHISSETSVGRLALSPKLLENVHCAWSKRLTIRDNKIWQGLDRHYGNRLKVLGGGIASAYVS